MLLHCGSYRLPLERPLIMGIVNLTPDSFSGDGHGGDVARAVDHAHRLIDEGADLLDLGAESSRPGAEPVSLKAELQRLLPVVEVLAGCGVPLSVDTYKPEVMQAVIAAGAVLINDITGFSNPRSIEVVADSHCGVCIMHMRGEPRTMQQEPQYGNVLAEVAAFLAERTIVLQAAGVATERIIHDPGFGFGKTLEHNLVLLRELDALRRGAIPLLAGLSRKSMLGAITGRATGERLAASIAAALLAAERGARILRVHDVAATRDALEVRAALAPWETTVMGAQASNNGNH